MGQQNGHWMNKGETSRVTRKHSDLLSDPLTLVRLITPDAQVYTLVYRQSKVIESRERELSERERAE